MNIITLIVCLCSVLLGGLSLAEQKVSVSVRVICDDAEIRKVLNDSVLKHLNSFSLIETSEHPAMFTLWLYAQPIKGEKDKDGCAIAVVYTSRLRVLQLKQEIDSKGLGNELLAQVDDILEDIEALEHMNVVHLRDSQGHISEVGVALADRFVKGKVLPLFKEIRSDVQSEQMVTKDSIAPLEKMPSPSEISQTLSKLDEDQAVVYGRRVARTMEGDILKAVKGLLKDEKNLMTVNIERRKGGMGDLAHANYKKEVAKVFPETFNEVDLVSQKIGGGRKSGELVRRFVEGFELESRNIRMGNGLEGSASGDGEPEADLRSETDLSDRLNLLSSAILDRRNQQKVKRPQEGISSEVAVSGATGQSSFPRETVSSEEGGLSEKEVATRDLEAADQVLNRVYREGIAALKKEMNDSEIPEGTGLGTKGAYEDLMKALTKAQRAWIAFKEADSELVFLQTVAVGGHGGAAYALTRELRLTRERIKFLETELWQ